jgi:nucleoside-diphosphate-sugar epimerase
LGIYGALKYAGEKLVISYGQVFDLPYTIVRPSALYGERCVSRRVGQIFIENAMKGVEVAVNGDGSDALDFTYIQDLVHGICRVIESDRSRGEIFNLTYGESRTMKQMADILSAHFSDITIKYLPKDKLMPERGTLCVDKARELLGYNPQFPLEKGFVNYIEWYKQLFEDRNKKTISDKVEVIGDKRRTMPKARRKKEAPSIAPVSVP